MRDHKSEVFLIVDLWKETQLDLFASVSFTGRTNPKVVTLIAIAPIDQALLEQEMEHRINFFLKRDREESRWIQRQKSSDV